MNNGAVITHEEKKIKGALWGAQADFAFLDPTYTLSVPMKQVISGAFDTLSHAMETYFGKPDENNLSDDINEAVMRSVIRNIRVLLTDKDNYEARSELTWASAMAENGILKIGKVTDFQCHMIEHQLGAYTNCNHGAGLAVIHPVLYRHLLPANTARFARFAQNVWGIDPAGKSELKLAQAGVEALAASSRRSGCPPPLQNWASLPTPTQGCGRFHRADRRLLQEAEPRRTAGHPQRVQVIKERKIQKELFIMEFITLNNGVKMPAEGIGTFLLTPDKAETAVLSALKDGARLIDTANAYCNEKAVGRAMKKSGLLREEIFLETKLWPTFYTDADAVDKTLARLDTDYIDLLLIHQPAGDYVAGYRLMEKAYKEGKVRAIGLSNFNEEQIKEILSICEVKPTILQTEVHPYAQQKELKAFLAENGMVIQAWYPLGHADKGLLEEPLFTRLAAKYGKSNVQIILRWHIQAGNVVIPGSKNPAHIHDNFDVFDFALTDAEMQEITTLNKDKRYYEVTEDKLAAFAPCFLPWKIRSKFQAVCSWVRRVFLRKMNQMKG